MGDVGDTFKALDDVMKERKARLGVECPACTVKLPKAPPKILLPGQRCWCGYRDPRKNLSHEVWEKPNEPDEAPNNPMALFSHLRATGRGV